MDLDLASRVESAGVVHRRKGPHQRAPVYFGKHEAEVNAARTGRGESAGGLPVRTRMRRWPGCRDSSNSRAWNENVVEDRRAHRASDAKTIDLGSCGWVIDNSDVAVFVHCMLARIATVYKVWVDAGQSHTQGTPGTHHTPKHRHKSNCFMTDSCANKNKRCGNSVCEGIKIEFQGARPQITRKPTLSLEIAITA